MRFFSLPGAKRMGRVDCSERSASFETGGVYPHVTSELGEAPHPALPTAPLRGLREGARLPRVIASTCQTATSFHSRRAPAPEFRAIPPPSPSRGRAERRVPDAPWVPDAMRGTPRIRSIRTFGFTGCNPALRTRCLVGSHCLYCPVDERPHHHDYRPTAVAWEPRAENRTPPDVVVRRAIRGIEALAGKPSQASGRSGADPIRLLRPSPSHRATPHPYGVSSHPRSAIVTNAIAPFRWSRTRSR